MQKYRLYAFVAHHYLSELQRGLQTAHVVGELSSVRRQGSALLRHAFEDWADKDKTIIICGAGNHQGVVDCFASLERLATPLALPHAIFREDEQSMNGMATACGVIVPEKYYAVKFFQEERQEVPAFWEYTAPNLKQARYEVSSPEGQLISHIKQYRLA